MTRLLVGLAVASSAAALAGCGGSRSTASGGTSPSATTVAVARTPATVPVGARSSSLARPGAAFATGEQATVGYTVQSSAGATVGTTRLALTVLSIQKGTLADFKGIQLDASERASTPEYVEVRLTNLGPLALNTNDDDDPAFAINGVDNTGQTQQSVTFFGTFPPCPDTDTPKPFAPGRSFQTCLTFLVPGGITRAAWTGTEDYEQTPVTWGMKSDD
jgi:hypothetical protein